MKANTKYVVKLDNPADYDAGALLEDVKPTVANQGGGATQDNLDSDGVVPSGGTYAQTAVTTGDAGENNHTLDFGFVPNSVWVGDTVWIDTNGNGIQDPGEPGIPGVTMTLTGPGGVTATTTTDAAGHYIFKDLPVLNAGESYTVTVDSTSPALAKYKPTTEGPGGGAGANDSSTGSADSGPLTTSGARDLTLDFGFVPEQVSVGDFVWVDSDGDGVQDPGEPGIKGVVLNLTDPDGNPVKDVNGNPVGPVTTDANGKYSFDHLPPLPAGKSYTVTIDQTKDSTKKALAPYLPTTEGASGGAGAADSSTWSAASHVDLSADGARDATLDFGFVAQKVSVGDYVWADTDMDGVQDAGEQGIKGIVMTLTGPDGKPVTDVNGNPVGQVTTDANGHYSFDNLPALPAGQHYTVSIDRNAPSTNIALASYLPTKAGVGSDGGADSSTWTAESGDLTKDGDRDPTLDFGFVPTVSVGDFVWADSNRNGKQDPGEDGIKGVVLKLTGPDGKPVTDAQGNPVGPVKTDANGHYSFDNLPPLPAGQHYTVSIDRNAKSTKNALKPYLPTGADIGSEEYNSSTWTAESGDLVNNGDHDGTLDFGFVAKPVSVGDTVWFDKDKDGSRTVARRASRVSC